MGADLSSLAFGGDPKQAKPPRPLRQREEPCQEDFDQYLRCCRENKDTIDMVDCEDITYRFRQCMEKSFKQSQPSDAGRASAQGAG
mmetsp:Transcript_53864/g.99553  ORF Transcript_53864/g.99553 Transcript_53864/m.99553 type:complete len:86 (+) Transcript_53864:64-321(+)